MTLHRHLIVLASCGWVALFLSGCAVKSDDDLRRTYLPEDQRVPVLIKTSGKLTYQTLEGSDIAIVQCRLQPTMLVQWPDGVDQVEQADVEILDEKWEGGKRLILRVILNGKALYDASICELHHVPMLRRQEQGVDGGEYPDSLFEDGEPKLFKNDGKVYLLCGSGIRYTVWRCPTCYEASERWRKRHGISN
jgi:hypothetical protein